MKSRSAKLIAVRRVTQDNQGKRTAGIDGVKSLTQPERLDLVNTLRIDRKAKGQSLPMMIAILSIVSFSSIGSPGQSTFPLSGNPFAYVGRAVSKFDSVGRRNGKRPDGFKAHHRDLCEI